MLLIASCGVLTAQSWLERPASRRLDSQRRWSARPFANYRVTVRVEYWGTMCSQDIESAGEKLHRIVRNDCRVSWLSLMTVAQLFEISEGLEHPTPCYVAAQTCSCYRVRAGEIAYDSRWATHARAARAIACAARKKGIHSSAGPIAYLFPIYPTDVRVKAAGFS